MFNRNSPVNSYDPDGRATLPEVLPEYTEDAWARPSALGRVGPISGFVTGYRVTTPDGTTITFDSYGNVLDANGPSMADYLGGFSNSQDVWVDINSYESNPDYKPSNDPSLAGNIEGKTFGSPGMIVVHSMDIQHYLAKYGDLNNNAWAIGLGAFGLSNGGKTELINQTVKYANRIGVNLGEGATNYLKVSKLIGKSVFIVNTGISGFNAGEAFYYDDPNKYGVLMKSTLDVTMGAIGVWGGPVGWVVSGTYFIGDLAGWWGDWGNPVLKY